MHPSERAHLARAEAWDRETLEPVIAPGSVEEADALARIDQARAEERARLQDTPEARARRLSQWWGRGKRSRFEG